MLNQSNFEALRRDTPEFMKKMQPEARSPELYDIDDMLNAGMLVEMGVNSQALDDKPGYVGHAIVVHSKDGTDYIAHDPGLPPVENRRIAP